MTSIGTQLERHKGVGPGFDAARLALAVSILCWHSVLTSYGRSAETVVWASPLSAPLTALMPMFFALSGFLVMGSFERTRNLTTFLGLRALRIVPALATEITVSALVLGSLLTTRPLMAYVSDPLFFKYFGSLVGKVSFLLPGVFEHNPDPGRVNVSLWTIAPELSCYVYLGLQMALRLRRTGITMAACILLAANVAADFASPLDPSDGVVLARYLVVAFALGNLLYLWRSLVPFNLVLFAACLLIGLVCVKSSAAIYIALACLAYVVVFVGCCPIPVPYPLSTGDYSYGLYLYAFPIQQLFSYLFPEFRQFYWNIAVCLPTAAVLACASWWWVERPALRGKALLYRATRSVDSTGILHMSIPVAALAAYGMVLSIASGFVASSDARVAVPAAVAAALVVSVLRWFWLRRDERAGQSDDGRNARSVLKDTRQLPAR